MPTRTLPFCLMLLLATAPASPQRAAQRSPQRAAHAPNIEIYVYRRAYTPDEKIELRLSAYNTSRVEIAAYRLDLPALIHTSRDVADLRKVVRSVDVRRLARAAHWTEKLGSVYPDQWNEHAAKVPHLAPGYYLIQARAAGVEKRTWLAVTDIALLSKRSRHQEIVFAADARSGRPVPGLRLAVVGPAGPLATVRAVTDAHGVLDVPYTPATHDTAGAAGPAQNIFWIHGERNGSPAFLLTGEPAPPDPFAVYAFTDRPVYRPGQRVLFKATVRDRLESDAPRSSLASELGSGFTYRPYARRPVTVELRDPTDALIYRRTLTTNGQGSLDGELQLASEPALGKWQLVTVIGEHRYYAAFDVLAYRKPEYTVAVAFPAAHFLGGSTVPVTVSARYYFGQPVANASVAYTIAFAAANSASEGEVEPSYEGRGVTDARGELKLEIRSQRRPVNRSLTVSATVTDLSRRSQSAAGSALITAGTFQLSYEADRWLYRPGDRATITVHATDYDGRPVQMRVTVRLIETLEDRQHRPYKQTTTRVATTSASGAGTAVFTPPRPGYLAVELAAFDQQNDRIESHGYLWVAGEEFEGYDYPSLGLVADKASYRPGETASLLLNTSLVTPHEEPAHSPVAGRRPAASQPKQPKYRTGWALVTVEGERIYRNEVVELRGRSTVLKVPIDARDFPSVEVSVCIVQERNVYQQTIRLAVPMDDHKLIVAVSPERTQYEPGQTATYTVTTRDWRGRPVAAEVGLGVVDASTYAIEPDATPDPASFFYGGQEERVETDFSFSAQYSGGAYQHVPTARQAAPPPTTTEGIRVRRRFEDTAYWAPFVATGLDGTARVTFALPDNLTTWRATARAITADTAAGQAAADVVASMPLLVRLELPRFYVDGDQAVVSAVVHNYTGATRTVRTRIEATGAALDGDATRTVEVPAGGQQRVDWRARIAADAGASPGSVRVLVVADGGPGGQDAAELTLPVQPAGLRTVQSRSAIVATADETRIADLPPDATLQITLAPSIGAAALDGLNDLAQYPYGCAEQTTSAWLPDIVVEQTLKRLGIHRTVNPHLEQWVNLGLQKLYRYQHADGGWNWWEFDETDGDMTAYVLYALAQAQRAGYLVDEARLARGAAALQALLAKERDPSRRADWLLSLSYVRPADTRRPLQDLFRDRNHLDSEGLASLVIALANVGDTHDLAMAAARELAAQARVTGTTAHWPAEQGGYSYESWRSDDVEVTAHAIRALLAATPQSAPIQPAIRWLMGNRTGASWGSTRASAEAIVAISACMERTGELRPHYHARVLVDSRVVREVDATPATALDPPVTVTLSPADLRGHERVTVVRDSPDEGSPLYATITTRCLLPPNAALAAEHGIQVRRTFRIDAEDPSHADSVASGAELEVSVDITAPSNYRYVVLEDPIPAGCEVAPAADTWGRYPVAYDENGGGGFARQEVRDDKVVYFFDYLPKGRTHLTYRLHAETPGVYAILPSVGWLNYFPEVRGNSGLVHARVTE